MIITVDERIRDEKLRCDIINREASKLSALLLGKTNKYEYVRAEKTLPLDQSRIIEKAKFIYPPVEKACKKQSKVVNNHRDK